MDFVGKRPSAGAYTIDLPRETNRMAGVSPEILRQILDQHTAALVLYARQWCSTPEDVVQDVFLLLMREPVAHRESAGLALSGRAQQGDQRRAIRSPPCPP